MRELSLLPERSDSVKSLTLAEFTVPRPAPPRAPFLDVLPVLGKIVAYAKIGLMAWGAISFGALLGMGIYHLNGGAETQVLVSKDLAAPAPQKKQAPSERLAALVDKPDPPLAPALAAALPEA